MDQGFAERFAAEWIAAWNAHDLDRILAHSADAIEMHSPFIVTIAGDPSGTLRGKGRVRAYWARALELIPDLRFELLSVLVGVTSLTLYYRGPRGLTAECLHFAEDGYVARAYAHYAPDVPIP